MQLSNDRDSTPTCRLLVKVTPGARSTAVVGWLGSVLKVRVAAPAERGRANQALVAFVAQHLGLPLGAVTVAGGTASERKTLLIRGLDADALRRKLSR